MSRLDLMQKRTFTKWANSNLRRAAHKHQDQSLLVQDLECDLDTGLRLIYLVEELQDKPVQGKFYQQPKNVIQQTQNLAVPLRIVNEHIKSQGLKLQYSPQNILDHDLTMILGLMWILISKFNMANISEEGASAKEALLVWCRKKVEGYGLKVNNFTSSWKQQGGWLFSALIHKHRPDLLPDVEARLARADQHSLLEECFALAEQQLGIPCLLEAEDVLELGDDKSMMTYLSYFWKAFAHMQQSETAARRLAKLLAYEQQSDQLVAQYAQRMEQLLAWAQQQSAAFCERPAAATAELLQQQREQLQLYREGEKVRYQEEKQALESTLATLNSKLRANGRPPYEPPAVLSIDFLTDRWAALAAAERQYDERTRLALAQAHEQQRLRQSLGVVQERYRQRAEQLSAWMAQQRADFTEGACAEEAAELDATLAAAFRRLSLGEVAKLESELNSYRRGVKPAMGNEKSALESLANTIEAKLRFEGLPPEAPPQGLASAQLAARWEQLQAAERCYERQLRATRQQLEKQQQLVAAFERKVHATRRWAHQQLALCRALRQHHQPGQEPPPPPPPQEEEEERVPTELADELRGSLQSSSGVAALIRRMQTQLEELAAKKAKLDGLQQLQRQLQDGEHAAGEGAQAQAEDGGAALRRCKSQLQELHSLLCVRCSTALTEELCWLERRLQQLSALDRCQLQFAQLAEEMWTSVQEQERELRKPFKCFSLEMVDKYAADLQRSAEAHARLVTELEQLGCAERWELPPVKKGEEEEEQLQQVVGEGNSFSRFSKSDLEGMLTQLHQLVEQKRAELREEEHTLEAVERQMQRYMQLAEGCATCLAQLQVQASNVMSFDNLSTSALFRPKAGKVGTGSGSAAAGVMGAMMLPDTYKDDPFFATQGAEVVNPLHGEGAAADGATLRRGSITVVDSNFLEEYQSGGAKAVEAATHRERAASRMGLSNRQRAGSAVFLLKGSVEELQQWRLALKEINSALAAEAQPMLAAAAGAAKDIPEDFLRVAHSERMDKGIHDLEVEFRNLREHVAERLNVIEACEELARTVAQLQARYRSKASNLQERVQEKLAHFAADEQGHYPQMGVTLAEVTKAAGELAEYQRGVRDAMASEKATLEALGRTLESKLDPEALATLGRQAHAPARVEGQWRQLVAAESAYEQRLQATLAQLKQQQQLVEAFQRKAGKLREWCAEVRQWCEAPLEPPTPSLGQMSLLLQELHSRAQQLGERRTKLARLRELAAQVQGEQLAHSFAEQLAQLEQQVQAAAALLEGEKRTQLQEAQLRSEQLDAQRLRTSQLLEELHTWLAEEYRPLQTELACHSLMQVHKQQQTLQQLRLHLGERQQQLEELKRQPSELTGESNKYARSSLPELEELAARLESAIGEREEELTQQLQIQQGLVQLVEDARASGAHFAEWCKQMSTRLQQAIQSKAAAVAAVVPPPPHDADAHSAAQDTKERVVQLLHDELLLLTGLSEEADTTGLQLLEKAKAADFAADEAGATAGKAGDSSEGAAVKMNELLAEWEELNRRNDERQKQLIVEIEAADELVELRERYCERARALVEWTEQQLASFRLDRPGDELAQFGLELAQVEARQVEMNKYEQGIKRAMANEKGALEVLSSALESKLINSSSGVPHLVQHKAGYQPPEELTSPALGRLWEELTAAQANFSGRLEVLFQQRSLTEKRLAKLNAKRSKYNNAIAALQQQSAEMAAAAHREHGCSSLVEARGACAAHAALVEQQQQLACSIPKLEKLAAQLGAPAAAAAAAASGGDAQEAELRRLIGATRAKFAEAQARMAADGAALAAVEEQWATLDSQLLGFATKAEELAMWVESCKEELLKAVEVRSVAEVEHLQQETALKPAEVAQRREQLEQAISSSSASEQQLSDNPYSRFSPAALRQMSDSLGPLIRAREQMLVEELARQQQHDQLRRRFAEQVKEFDGWVALMKEKISAAGAELGEEMAKLDAVCQIESSILGSEQQQLKQVEACHHALLDANVRENQYTDRTIGEVVADWELLLQLAKEKRSILQSEIESKSQGQVSVQQQRELQEMFRHFDKGAKGKLAEYELKAVLMNLDMEVPEGKLQQVMKEGPIDMESFQAFMLEEMRDSDSFEQILESFRIAGGAAGGEELISKEMLQRPPFSELISPEMLEYLESRMEQQQPPHEHGQQRWNFRQFAAKVFGLEGYSNVRTVEGISQLDHAQQERVREAEEAKEKARLLKEEAQRRQEEEQQQQRQQQKRRQEQEAQRKEQERQRKQEEEEEERRRQEQKELARRKEREQEEQRKRAEQQRLEEARARVEAEKQRKREEEAAKLAKEQQAEERRKAEGRAKEEAKAKELAAREERKRVGLEGALEKKTSGGMFKRSLWHERYVCLRADGVLRYGASSTDKLKELPLTPTCVAQVEGPEDKKPFCFSVGKRDDPARILFSAADDATRQAWLQQIALWCPPSP